MDRPTDLTGRTGGDPDEGSDDVVRAFRAALGEGHGSSSGSETRTTTSGASEQSRPQAPASLLAAVERRAARLHRRRQAAALGGAAAAAAVVVFLGSLVLPQLDLSLSSGASGGSAAGGAAPASGQNGGDSGAAAPSASSNGINDAPGVVQDGTTSATAESRAAAAPTLSEASMLTAADLAGAFSVPVRESAPAPESDPRLTLGACVDGDAGSVDALQLWRVDLTAAPSASAAEPPGVVERVAVIGGPAVAASALEQVRQALPGCSGPGLEGTGPTTALDATAVTPEGGQALVLASTSGQGSPALRVYVAIGSELVQLDATSDASSTQAAYSALVPAIRTAVQRATGGAASFTAPLPSAGAP